MANYSKDDGTVYGRVLKNKYNTYDAYWVVPHGYYSGGEDSKIGEYTTEEIAQQKLKEWIDNQLEKQKAAKKELNKPLKTGWFW